MTALSALRSAEAAGVQRVQRRRAPVTATTAAAAVLLGLVALGIGDYPLSLPAVVHAIAHDDGFATVVVVQWRLPRVAAALAFGAALAAAGALFQSLTRNPLGSPDVIGFATGSYTGVLIVTTLLAGTPLDGTLGIAGGSMAGGLATAFLVYALAYRRGICGMQLIVTGIAVTAMLHAVNVWLQLRTQVEVAMSASVWAAGTLGTVDWTGLAPALAVLAVCGVGVAAATRPLQQLELGDAAAASHGVRVGAARLWILVLGVALTAVVTAVTGPIAFVALAAPQLAKRMVGGAGLPLAQSALTGAVLLLTADLVAQYALPQAVPVGVVTVVVGGCYLVVLLLRGARRRQGR